MEEKKKNIKNMLYRDFLDNGRIKIFTIEDIEKGLANVRGRNSQEARALIITMYYTGARPNEVLRLKAKDIVKETTYINITLQPSKRGLVRTLPFSLSKPHIKDIWDYAKNYPPEMYIFYHFQSNNKRVKEIQLRNGQRKFIEYTEITNKLRYHFKKWFKEDIIIPYYLRHNRFSQMAQNGADIEDIRQWKGGKTINSVYPYLHMSIKKAKKTERLVR